MQNADAASDRISASTWLALAAMGLGVFVIANDFTALSVAIPRLESQLHTTLARAQWVINGYALVFGVLIVTGGRLADIFGRKRMLIAGAAGFGLASLAAGLAPNIGLLIVFRALMGVGGAIMWPAVLGLTYTILPDEKKGLAGGLILGVAGLGNAVGPLLGGWLTDVASWRVVFFVNLPITALTMFMTWRAVPESSTAGSERRIDYPGIALLSGGAVCILLALDLGTGDFGRPLIVSLFIAGVALLAGFFLVERRQGSIALVPAPVLRNRVFAAASLTVLMISAIFFSALLYLPQFFETYLGFSALRAGAGLLPLMGAFAVTSFAAGPLYNRLGPKLIVTTGTACLTAGILLLSQLSHSASYPSLLAGMLVLGVGVGLFYSSVTTAAVTSVDPGQASLAGGIIYMAQVAGGAIGLGLNTAIVLSSASLAGGIQVAFRVDGALGAAGFIVALAFVHGQKRPDAHPAARAAHHRVHA